MKLISKNCIIVYRGDLGITSIYSSEYKGKDPFEVAEFIAEKAIDRAVAVCPTTLTIEEYKKFERFIINDLLETLKEDYYK